MFFFVGDGDFGGDFDGKVITMAGRMLVVGWLVGEEIWGRRGGCVPVQNGVVGGGVWVRENNKVFRQSKLNRSTRPNSLESQIYQIVVVV